jgi:hypothetical protein
MKSYKSNKGNCGILNGTRSLSPSISDTIFPSSPANRTSPVHILITPRRRCCGTAATLPAIERSTPKRRLLLLITPSAGANGIAIDTALDLSMTGASIVNSHKPSSIVLSPPLAALQANLTCSLCEYVTKPLPGRGILEFRRMQTLMLAVTHDSHTTLVAKFEQMKSHHEWIYHATSSTNFLDRATKVCKSGEPVRDLHSVMPTMCETSRMSDKWRSNDRKCSLFFFLFFIIYFSDTVRFMFFIFFPLWRGYHQCCIPRVTISTGSLHLGLANLYLE